MFFCMGNLFALFALRCYALMAFNLKINELNITLSTLTKYIDYCINQGITIFQLSIIILISLQTTIATLKTLSSLHLPLDFSKRASGSLTLICWEYIQPTRQGSSL
jgi:hypothetical protein